MYRIAVRGLLASACFVLCALPSRAQDDDPPRSDEVEAGRTADDTQERYDQLTECFKTPAFSLGLLLQGVGTFALEAVETRPDAFRIGAARIKIHGELDRGFGYLLQTDFARSPALLDAQASYAPSAAFRIHVGRYKVPFSYETLTSSASTDFVNRARVVRAISPGRAVGAGLRATALARAVELRAGVFNAVYERTRTGARADDEREPGDVLVAGRLAVRSGQARQPRSDGLRLVVGANVGYETPGTSALGAIPARFIAGADARLLFGPVLFAAEGLVEYIDTGGPQRQAEGYYFTLGYDVHDVHRLLARLDAFEGTEQLVVGYTVTFTRAASFQANLALPVDDRSDPIRFLFNAQFAF